MTNAIEDNICKNEDVGFRWFRIVDGIIFGEIREGELQEGELTFTYDSDKQNDRYEISDICRFSTYENLDEHPTHFHAKVKET